MRLIVNGTQAASPPAIPAPVGTPGYPTDGNPGAGEEAGILDAATFYVLMMEIANAVTDRGSALDQTGADLHQLSKAMRGRLLNVRTVTASGTYNPTPGTNAIYVQVYGGGGAGGGTNAPGAGQVAGGSGGAAGGTAEKYITSGFAGVTMTIGAGGIGVPSGAGGAGGTTSFGALCSATGGGGGSVGIATAPANSLVGGALGGVGAGGDVNSQGGEGIPGFSAVSPVSGSGGANGLGAGARLVSSFTNGNSATTLGTGGSGGCAPSSSGITQGGYGAAGLIRIWEFG
jgi:hypothetical protein